jgi:hypothetical protein
VISSALAVIKVVNSPFTGFKSIISNSAAFIFVSKFEILFFSNPKDDYIAEILPSFAVTWLVKSEIFLLCSAILSLLFLISN